MNETLSSEQMVGALATARPAGAERSRSLKQGVRAVGAALVSTALVGVFALPVYATSTDAALPTTTRGFAQALSTESVTNIAVPAHLPTAEQQPVVVQPTVAAVSYAATSTVSSGWSADIAASGLGQAIVAAAYSELGVYQDCTDLVQNALAGAGLAERRDQGGYDHGPYSLRAFGADVTNGEWAPGDILGWPGYPHVAIYIGDGLAIHGGMGGTTVVTSATGYFGSPAYVVRAG